jgi:predicted DNA repair protein MutK
MALARKPAVKKDKIEVSASDIEWIKENISSMSLKIQEVNLSLLKLNQTVIGDEAYGQVGLIKKVDEHNAYIEKDKQFKSKLVGGGLVLSFLWGLVLKFWKI